MQLLFPLPIVTVCAAFHWAFVLVAVVQLGVSGSLPLQGVNAGDVSGVMPGEALRYFTTWALLLQFLFFLSAALFDSLQLLAPNSSNWSAALVRLRSHVAAART